MCVKLCVNILCILCVNCVYIVLIWYVYCVFTLTKQCGASNCVFISSGGCALWSHQRWWGQGDHRRNVIATLINRDLPRDHRHCQYPNTFFINPMRKIRRYKSTCSPLPPWPPCSGVQWGACCPPPPPTPSYPNPSPTPSSLPITALKTGSLRHLSAFQQSKFLLHITVVTHEQVAHMLPPWPPSHNWWLLRDRLGPGTASSRFQPPGLILLLLGRKPGPASVDWLKPVAPHRDTYS